MEKLIVIYKKIDNDIKDKILRTMQKILDMQRPWGEWREFFAQSQKELQTRGRFRSYSMIPKTKMFVTLLSTELIYNLFDDKFIDRIKLSLDFAQKNIKEGLFQVLSESNIDLSYSTTIRSLEYIKDVRHTAQGLQLMYEFYDKVYKNNFYPNIIDNILKGIKKIATLNEHEYFFPDELNRENPGLGGTLHCIELLYKFDLNKFKNYLSPADFNELNNTIIRRRQNAIDWFINYAKKNNNSWGLNELKTDRAWWTSVILLRIGDILFKHDYKFLEKVINQLKLERQGDHWKGEIPEKNFETTAQVLCALNNFKEDYKIETGIYERAQNYIFKNWNFESLQVGEACCVILSNQENLELIRANLDKFYNYFQNEIPSVERKKYLKRSFLLSIEDELMYLSALKKGYENKHSNYPVAWKEARYRLEKMIEYFLFIPYKNPVNDFVEKIINYDDEQLDEQIQKSIKSELDNPDNQKMLISWFKDHDVFNISSLVGTFLGAFSREYLR